MYDIDYLPIARQDIAAIIIYIFEHLKAPQAAMDLLNALDHSILLLQEFPYAHSLYRPIKPLDAEYRLLPVKNYNIFYLVCEPEKRVEIRRILYAKMDLAKIME